MAAKSPAAVVTRASAMPGATARRLAEPEVPSPEKASMMPQTVPKRPMKGVTPAVVASQDMPFSTRRISSEEASCILTVTACMVFSLGGAAVVLVGGELGLEFAIAGSVDIGERRTGRDESLGIGDALGGAENFEELVAFAADAAEES